MSIFITQLIYIKQDAEAVFHQFEDLVLPFLPKYNGQLLLRVRPTGINFVESTIEQPYEIHLVEFTTDQDFQNYMNDKERQKFLHLKEQSIRSVMLIKGNKL